MELGVPSLERTLRLVISPPTPRLFEIPTRIERISSFALFNRSVISAIRNGFLLVGMILGTITRLTLNLKLGEGFQSNFLCTILLTENSHPV